MPALAGLGGCVSLASFSGPPAPCGLLGLLGRVHDLHVSIADIQSSCVAPVGLVWDRVISLLPNLELHQTDGNHASDTGNFLTALVFYQTISGNSADLIPFISSINIDAATQELFGQITSEVIAEHPPCEY